MNFKKNKRRSKEFSTGNAAREFLRRRLHRLRNGPDPATGDVAYPDQLMLGAETYDDRGFTSRIDALTSETATFGVMVVKADALTTDMDNAAAEDREPATDHIAGIIGEICGREEGAWGRLESGMLGCCIPGVDAESCLAISKEIILDVGKLNNGSVSIGSAGYPMLDYERGQVVENAHKALNHAAFFGPGSAVAFDAVSLNISGDAMYQSGDIGGAADEFERGLKIDPQDENLHNSLGVCYGEKGDFDKALKAFERAVAINSENVMALHNAGYTKAMLNDTEGALEYFMRADALGENLFEVVFHTGKLLVETGNQEKAKPYLERAVKLNPDSGKAYFFMGECSREIGQKDEAVNAYKAAIKRNPNDAAALSALGLLYDEMGENPEIPLIFCEKSVEISPDNGLFTYRLGQVLQNQKETKRALAMFEKALTLGYDAEEQAAAARAELSGDGQSTLDKERSMNR